MSTAAGLIGCNRGQRREHEPPAFRTRHSVGPGVGPHSQSHPHERRCPITVLTSSSSGRTIFVPTLQDVET